MATHPYISGAGNITKIIEVLRKNFPGTVNSETVRKLNLASKNESYVINVLQFLNLVDVDGKRTDMGHEVMTIHKEADFQSAFSDLIRKAYNDLFEIRGDDAWTMSKDDLVAYFRSADKTSDVVGGRQAGVFIALRELAGHKTATDEKPTQEKSVKTAKKNQRQRQPTKDLPILNSGRNVDDAGFRNMALTVRIEINLPSDGSQETYDAIFKSIRANLLP